MKIFFMVKVSLGLQLLIDLVLGVSCCSCMAWYWLSINFWDNFYVLINMVIIHWYFRLWS